MDLSYIVNKDLFSTSQKLHHAGNDTPVVIEAGQEFISPRLDSIGQSYFRLQLNFDQAVDMNKVQVNMKDVNKGASPQSSAAGMDVTLPMLTASSFGNSLHLNKVLYTDGDIPLFNDDFFIKIKNNGSEAITLRNFNLRYVR